MAFVVTENCIKCKFTDCVDVCPVDCFHEGPLFLVIDPDECIDCSLCEPECPANAIHAEECLPENLFIFVDLNANFSKVWPSITSIQQPLPDAHEWINVQNKMKFLDSETIEKPNSNNSAQQITPEEVERLLTDPNPKVRKSIIRNPNVSLTTFQIIRGLGDSDYNIRSRCEYLLLLPENKSNLRFCLYESNLNIREFCVKNYDYLDEVQIEEGLKDPSFRVRAAYVNRKEFIAQPRHLEEALKTEYLPYIMACLGKLKKNATPLLLDLCLKSKYSEVREKVASCADFELNNIQIKKLQKDKIVSVRLALVNFYQQVLTDDQIQVGLGDSSETIKRIYKRISRERLFYQEKVYKPATEYLGDSAYNRLPDKLRLELKNINTRLTQKISENNVLYGIKFAAKHGNGCCLLLQPGDSGYQWSTRIIPLVFIANINNSIRVRLIRGRSYRNSSASPSYWEELRAFPRGDANGKLQSWSRAYDGDTIEINDALSIPEISPNCSVNEWYV